MSVKDSPGTLPVALYEQSSPKVRLVDLENVQSQSVEFTQNDRGHLLHRESKFLCVKNKTQYFSVAKLQEAVYASAKRVAVVVYEQDPFMPTAFVEDRETTIKTDEILFELERCSTSAEGVFNIDEEEFMMVYSKICSTREVIHPYENDETSIDIHEANEPNEPMRRSYRKRAKAHRDEFTYDI